MVQRKCRDGKKGVRREGNFIIFEHISIPYFMIDAIKIAKHNNYRIFANLKRLELVTNNIHFMNTLIYIALLGVFTCHSVANGNESKGSSAGLKFMLLLFGALGYLLYAITLIWSFWHFVWWQPVVTALVTSIIIAPITAPIFQKNLIGNIISPVCVVVFSFLSIWQLL